MQRKPSWFAGMADVFEKLAAENPITYKEGATRWRGLQQKKMDIDRINVNNPPFHSSKYKPLRVRSGRSKT